MERLVIPGRELVPVLFSVQTPAENVRVPVVMGCTRHRDGIITPSHGLINTTGIPGHNAPPGVFRSQRSFAKKKIILK